MCIRADRKIAAPETTAAFGQGWIRRADAPYPLELCVATDYSLHHYVPDGHGLRKVPGDDLRPAIWQAGLRQAALREALAVLVNTAVYERTAVTYGDRAERNILLEAGHAERNILLQAVARDLGAVPIGAFYDDQLAESLSLPADQAPLYVNPVGHPGGR